MPSKSHLSVKKKRKDSIYYGVYKIKSSKRSTWQTVICNQGKKIIHGPFRSEIKAAQMYDDLVRKFNPKRLWLNFPTKDEEERMEVVETVKKIPVRSLQEGDKKIHKRVTFPIVTRNRVCAKQGWRCNYCQELLGDVFIVDHMVPLFLGGSNEEFNLQGLCPSCDRFKTSYLDWKVLQPHLKKNGTLTAKDVLTYMKSNYHKLMCSDPQVVNGQNIETKEGKTISLTINGIEIKINT